MNAQSRDALVLRLRDAVPHGLQVADMETDVNRFLERPDIAQMTLDELVSAYVKEVFQDHEAELKEQDRQDRDMYWSIVMEGLRNRKKDEYETNHLHHDGPYSGQRRKSRTV